MLIYAHAMEAMMYELFIGDTIVLFAACRFFVKPVVAKEGRIDMELFYWIGGIISVGLFVYLMIALIRPESLS